MQHDSCRWAGIGLLSDEEELIFGISELKLNSRSVDDDHIDA